jgi:hypothetical protein
MIVSYEMMTLVSFNSQGQLVGPSHALIHVCMVIDTMGAESRKKVMDWYISLQLQDYRHLFHPTNMEVHTSQSNKNSVDIDLIIIIIDLF